MDDRTLQHAFNPGAAVRHFVGRDLLGLLRQIAMGDRVRADRDQGIGGERLQLVPGHAELPADRAFIDAVSRAQRRHLARQIVLARQSAQPAVQTIEGGLLGRRGGSIETSRSVADRDFDRTRLRDHRLQRDPPQPARAFGEIADHMHGQRCVKFAHHRQREIPVVAITVVEGEAGKPP